MGSPAVTPDQSGTMGAPAPDQQSAPTPQDAGVQPTPAPQVGPPAAPPAAPPQPGNKWANIVKGALSGLALGGAPGFVAGAIAPTATRQALKNEQSEGTSKAQQAAANVRFTDAQAASLQKDTAIRQIQAENQTKDTQLAIQKNDEEMANSFMARGAQPVIVTDGAHPEAFQAGLKSLTDASGAVPSLVTFHVGDKLMSFDVSQLSQNPAILQTVNKMRAVQGLPAMASSTWNNAKMLPVAAKTKMITDSAHFLNPVPESDPDKLKNQTYQYQNFLTAAKGMEDTPDKADTVAKLTAAVKTLQNAPGASGPTEKEKSQIRVGVTVAGARAAAINNSKGVEVAGDNGGTHFITMGDAIKSGAVGPKTAAAILPLEKTAEDAEKSYQMFQSAFADYQKGTPTGAQSMLALSQHLATTFGNVKGARVTKDMIQEHLGARSVSDSTVATVNKFINGDVLSPDQWNAFKGLIGQSRKLAWGTYATTAAAKGLNVRGLVPKDLGGQRDINDTTATPGKSGGAISVTDPAGGVHNFPDQASADNFKKLAKIQ